jgi:DNA ligase (NAD+)
VAESIAEFLSSEANRRTLERLRQAGVTTSGGAPSAADGPLRGLTVVITGGLEGLSREEAKRAVARAGGKATESVSRSTSFVVAGRGAGSKLARAEALGLPVLDEEAFLAVLAGQRPPPLAEPAE